MIEPGRCGGDIAREEQPDYLRIDHTEFRHRDDDPYRFHSGIGTVNSDMQTVQHVELPLWHVHLGFTWLS
jgi:hypothetical protein